ncbi:hypothetical protein [uncultured Victivallis sp.]|uniref:hypothetical protein n=1 Tax=uncultured Victivallis sp. TaxID=354118 RepID=UPI0025E2957E|nr:hypothetical protein [uncultured Victivallis sp.]
MGVNDSARLLMRRLIKFALVIAVLYGAVWSYFNWDYILEKFGAKYEVSRYGIIWNTNLSAAKRTAAKYNRDIMIVYIRSGAKHDPSEYLINRIFPSTQFRRAADTYIPLLIDASGGADESARIKQNRDEIVKAYDLWNRPGQLLLLDSSGKELSRVQYQDQPVSELISELSGGNFKPLPAIPRPGVKDPFAESEKKARELTGPTVKKSEESPKVEEKWGFTTGL